MPVYAYKGYDGAGKTVSGRMDAENARGLKALLRRDGVFVTDVKETKSGVKKSVGKKRIDLSFLLERVSPQDLAVATRQLSTLVGAGIPLVDSLVALVDQIEIEHFKAVWSDVKQNVNEGAAFADALANHPRVFSGLYINMVRAGETSGALDVVLNRLADFTESQAELQSKVYGTMFYPIIMMVMAVGVIALLFVVVIPKITQIFQAQNVALPLPTMLLIGTSNFLQGYWFILLPALVGAGWGFKRYISTGKGRVWWHRFVLNVPIFGPLLRMIAVTRFSKTLATLLGSGVPVLTAFDIVKAVLQNDTLVRVIDNVRDCVKEGESIAAPLKRSKEFPPIVTHMIAVGEKSGQLEEMLGNIAKAYEVQVESRLQAMTSTLEPLMIVVMGGVVGFIVFAILLPMLEITSFAQ